MVQDLRRPGRHAKRTRLFRELEGRNRTRRPRPSDRHRRDLRSQPRPGRRPSRSSRPSRTAAAAAPSGRSRGGPSTRRQSHPAWPRHGAARPECRPFTRRAASRTSDGGSLSGHGGRGRAHSRHDADDPGARSRRRPGARLPPPSRCRCCRRGRGRSGRVTREPGGVASAEIALLRTLEDPVIAVDERASRRV